MRCSTWEYVAAAAAATPCAADALLPLGEQSGACDAEAGGASVAQSQRAGDGRRLLDCDGVCKSRGDLSTV